MSIPTSNSDAMAQLRRDAMAQWRNGAAHLTWDFFNNQRRAFSPGGVYAATFAYHMDDLMSGGVAPIKVGWSRHVAGRFDVADKSFLPSPVVGLRLYHPTQAEFEEWGESRIWSLLMAMESFCHRQLREGGYARPGPGREWFVASLEDLDEHIQNTQMECVAMVEYALETHRQPMDV